MLPNFFRKDVLIPYLSFDESGRICIDLRVAPTELSCLTASVTIAVPRLRPKVGYSSGALCIGSSGGKLIRRPVSGGIGRMSSPFSNMLDTSPVAPASMRYS